MRPIVSIHGSVWAADSHGLFDYESSAIYAKSFRVSGVRDSYTIVLKDEQLQVIDSNRIVEASPSNRLLLRLEWRDGEYYLIPPNDSFDQQKLWIVVRSGRAVVLQREDTLKLGRYKLRVRDIVLGGGLSDDDDDGGTHPNHINQHMPHDEDGNDGGGGGGGDGGQPAITHEQHTAHIDIDEYDDDQVTTTTKCITFSKENYTTDDIVCRICLCGEEIDNNTNPLISPCKCSGSMKWVHLQCLRTWMSGRLNLSSDACTLSFYWRSLECELCRIPYPRKICTNENPEGTDLLALPKLKTPYIILSPLTPRNSSSRGVHVVSVGPPIGCARVGRGHESEVRLADISVSRIHANIRYQSPMSDTNDVIIGSEGPVQLKQFINGCLLLEDARSKFGTLLEVRQPLKLLVESSVSIQVGRVVLMFNVKRRRRFPLPSCLKAAGNVVTDDITVLQEESPASLLSREAPI